MVQPEASPARPTLPDCLTARQIRLGAGWSQKRLADEIGVTEQTVLRWEYGRAVPVGSNLTRYAALLDRLTHEADTR